MDTIKYFFSNAINGLFELPAAEAKKFVPSHVVPVEPYHGTSLLAITMFNFDESPVGPYRELVISLFVAPRLGTGRKHPHSAVFPLVVASSNAEARDHAIELWHLPHFMEDIDINFSESKDGNKIRGEVFCHKGKSIMSLTLSQNGFWDPALQLYQSFQGDESGNYIGIMDISGDLSEHEEGTGSVEFMHHRFFDSLDLSQMNPFPFREMWMKNGVETYHELLTL